MDKKSSINTDRLFTIKELFKITNTSGVNSLLAVLEAKKRKITMPYQQDNIFCF
jgi:hypothetical protein